jgi:hypothetical protein
MGWGSGVFTRTNGVYSGNSVWAQDEGAGVDITSSRHDNHDLDLANGINQCVNKDGSNAANVVTTSWIANGAITTAKLAAGAVTSVATNAIGTDAITDGAVTEAKLSDDAASRSTLLYSGGAKAVSGGTIALGSVVNGSSSSDILPWVVRIPMPKAGKVTHLTMSIDGSISSGTMTVTLYKNGSNTSQAVSLTSGFRKSQAIAAVSFVAEDYIYLEVSGTFTLTDAAVVHGAAWGHFTA